MGRLIDGLIRVAAAHPRGVFAATALLVTLGIWAFGTLNTDAFPDLTPNQVLVMTTLPGLSPAEVEQQVTYPMEVAMLGLPRNTGVRSISKAGLSVVTIGFEDGVDFYFARALVQQRMQDARAALPPEADVMLGPPATAMGEILQYLVETTDSLTGAGAADSTHLLLLTNTQEYLIRPLLRMIPGVADVNSWGGMRQQFEIQVDPAKLAGFDLTLPELGRALERNNTNFGGGYLEDRGDRLTLRGLGRVGDTTQIGLVVVATRGTTPVHVRDVARVTMGPELRYGAVTRDGRGEALSATILMLKGANGREVAQRVAQKLAEIQPLLPPGIRVRPFYNQGDVVDRTTQTVFRNLIEGALLVIAVLLLFLRHWRASLLTASVIPLSLLGAFLAMKEFGMTANLMSLGALDFGLIVDASIVTVENILRRRTITDAVLEVGRPVAFGILIIVAVYAPLTALEGLERKMFIPMAFTVCAAILVSLLLALTFVPAAAGMLLRPGSGPAEGDRGPRWFESLAGFYGRVLERAMASPGQVAGVAIGLLLAALLSVPFLGSEFMPKLDEGYLLIESRRLPSVSLAQGIQVSGEIERTLLRFPEVARVVTNLGRPQEATEAMALNQSDSYLLLRPRREWQTGSLDALIGRMDSALAEIPGLEYEFTAPMRMRLDEVVSGVRTDLGIKVFGDSLEVLQRLAGEIRMLVEPIPGAEDVSVGVSAGALQLELGLDRQALARYGLSVEDVQSAVTSGVGGRQVSEVIDGRRRYPIVVRLDPAYRATPDAIGRLQIPTSTGGAVVLSQVAALRTVEGPEVINHEGGIRYVVVQANVRGRDLGGFAAEVARQVRDRVTLPPGYYLDYGGQFENQQRASSRLLFIVPLVLLLIAGLLYVSFGVLRHALLVMLDVPFALVGGVAALWLRGMHFNLSAAVGMIAVFGVAILNGLVLVTTINQLRAGRVRLGDAIRQGALLRLRPVLMTAMVASVGFLPMALSTSSGAEVQKPLATVVIGGLVSATLLTLVVLPSLYGWMERRFARD